MLAMDIGTNLPAGFRIDGGRSNDRLSDVTDAADELGKVRSFEDRTAVGLADLVDAVLAGLELRGIDRALFGATSHAPVVTVASSALSFEENGLPLVIDANLTVTDTDSLNLTGATVTIAAGYSAGSDGDRLEFTAVSGINGAFDAATGILTFAGQASVASYQQLLRSVRFLNSSDNPGGTQRLVRFVVRDGNLTGQAERTINVQEIDDVGQFELPPEFADPNNIPTRAAGTEFQVQVNVSDPDDTNYTFQLDLEQSGIPDNTAQPEIGSVTGLLRWTPAPSLVGQTVALRVIAVTENGVANQQVLQIAVVAAS